MAILNPLPASFDPAAPRVYAAGVEAPPSGDGRPLAGQQWPR